MGTNPFFNKFLATNEQNLYDRMFVEAIEIKGMDLYYLPRTLVNPDYIFGEDAISEFNSFYNLPGLPIGGVTDWGGDQEVLTKFGLDIKNQLTVQFARTTFQTELAGANIKIPRIGDLVFFPLDNAMMQIVMVEDERPWFILGTRFIFEIKLELFEFSHEIFNTGDVQLDAMYRSRTYTIELILASGSGNYTVDEVVYQGASLGSCTARATVTSWNATTRALRVRKIIGEMHAGTAIVGNTSTTSRTISSFSTQSVGDAQDNTDAIQTAADLHIIDDNNPWGST